MCVCVCVKKVLAVLAAPALALLTGYKLIADSGNQNKTCDNKPLEETDFALNRLFLKIGA